MFVLKAKPKNCAPHSPQTDEPRNTKTGMGHLGPNMTPSAKNGSDRFTGGGATQPPISCRFWFFSFLFFWPGYSPNRWTDVDGWWLKRRVLAQGSAFWGSRDHVIKTVGVAPQKPPFWALFGKTWFAVGIGLKLTYNRDQSSDVSQQWLKWCVFRPDMSSSEMKLHSSIRGCTGPQKPQNLGDKGTAKK